MFTETQTERLKYLARELRSGKYPECAGQLRRGERFCAIGVACDILVNETDKGLCWEGDEAGKRLAHADERHGAADWSKQVGGYFGLSTNEALSIADANDHGASAGMRHEAAARVIDALVDS